MTIVDSSVWIDYFNGNASAQTDLLESILGVEPVGIGDVILVEVLQGFRSDADYRTALGLLTTLEVFDMLGASRAVKSADRFRALRKRGITIRKTVDTIIAGFCIEMDIPLLYSDKDFDPYVKWLGLRIPV